MAGMLPLARSNAGRLVADAPWSIAVPCPPVRMLLAVAGFFVVPAHLHAVETVTTCGQFFRGSAMLSGDLDCSATDDDAVKLQGRLHLNGFSLTGHPAHDVVHCEKGACRIDGPGTLTGGSDGVRSDKNTRLVDVTVTGNAGNGVRALKTARLDGGTVTGNGGDGVRADKIKAFGTQFIGNAGAGARTVRKASLYDCTVTGNAGDGVRSDRLAQISHGTIVTANALDGVDAGRVMLKRISEVAMNGTSPACGVSEACDDLATAYRPVISLDSTCGTSRDTVENDTWGACAAD